MESIAVAVALSGGEMAPGIISSLESHPLLDLCGIARSVPDLVRLLQRFRPHALLASPSLLEDLDPAAGPAQDAAWLSAPVTFFISHAGETWGEGRLAELLRLPLKYGGLIDAAACGREELYAEVKRVLDIHRAGEGLPRPQRGREGEAGRRSGLLILVGCKGGVGSTLLACSLAAAASSAGRRVLLMEGRRALSQLLFLKPRGEGKTVSDLLPLAEDVSWDLIRVSVHRHAAGFYLLPCGDGATPDAAPGALLRNLLFLFDLVVFDHHAGFLRAFPPLLVHDPTVLLVSRPDTLAATCARGAASALLRAGLEHERLKLVVNACGPHHTLSPPELARAAGIDLIAALPDDPRSGLDFAELGSLPRADSPLGRNMLAVAASLGYGGTARAGEAAPGRAWRRRGSALLNGGGR